MSDSDSGITGGFIMSFLIHLITVPWIIALFMKYVPEGWWTLPAIFSGLGILIITLLFLGMWFDLPPKEKTKEKKCSCECE